MKKVYEIEDRDGRFRIFYPESKLKRDKETIFNGPWCISAEEVQRWWNTSDMASEMRWGPPQRKSA